jgi:hypothetical protein
MALECNNSCIFFSSRHADVMALASRSIRAIEWIETAVSTMSAPSESGFRQ